MSELDESSWWVTAATEDYRRDAEAYELEERARPDEMTMLDAAGQLAAEVVSGTPSASVVDLCCGTGLSFRSLVDHPNLARLVGVDICLPYLDFAYKNHRRLNRPPYFVRADAVNPPLRRRQWDLAILASAYHHIEDERKVAFLQSTRCLLKPGGLIVFAENILPEHGPDANSKALATRLFYAEVLREVRRSVPAPPPRVEELIKKVAQYGFDGDYEYKVGLARFKEDVAAAALEFVHIERVWPSNGPLISTTGGNYVALARPG